jgi:hypothetical protein
MRATGSLLVPVFSGALATTAAAMLVGGWPGLPPITGLAPTVAGGALLVTPLLLLLVASVRTGSDVAGDRLVAARTHPDRAHRGPGQLLDPVHVGAGGGRQLIERPERRQVLEPAR